MSTPVALALTALVIFTIAGAIIYATRKRQPELPDVPVIVPPPWKPERPVDPAVKQTAEWSPEILAATLDSEDTAPPFIPPPAPFASHETPLAEAPAPEPEPPAIKEPAPMPEPTRPPLDHRTILMDWLRKEWPAYKIDTGMDLAMRLTASVGWMIEAGYAPATGPVERWAWIAAQGYQDVAEAAAADASRGFPTGVLDDWDAGWIAGQPPVVSFRVFCAKVIKAAAHEFEHRHRAAVVAFTAQHAADDFLAVADVLTRQDWPSRIDEMVD